MREILFRAKRIDNGEWVEGYYADVATNNVILTGRIDITQTIGAEMFRIIPETVGQYTGLTDKNSKKIFEGDIVQYNTFNDFDCQSIVIFGEYEQDGSDGEYLATKCIGFFVEVENFTCPDWYDNNPDCFPGYLTQQNILEIANNCEVIGNIYDNPELLEEVK